MSGYPPPGGNPPNPYGPRSGGRAGGGPIAPGSVKNYMIESILCLLFCGGLIAIPAIIYASQVDSKLSQGDYHGAVAASNSAKLWCIISLCVWLVMFGCGMLFFLMAVLAGAAA